MNAEILKKLITLAGEVGLTIETAEDTMLLYSGCQHSEPPVASISLDQPQHEVIFTLLREIAPFTPQLKNPRPLPVPWFVNRPYENEILGDATYKTRRALRQKCGKPWQADLWAMTTFPLIGTKDDIKAFLERHPEKLALYLRCCAGHLKAGIQKFVRKLFRQ